jgi:hypothetical protein
MDDCGGSSYSQSNCESTSADKGAVDNTSLIMSVKMEPQTGDELSSCPGKIREDSKEISHCIYDMAAPGSSRLQQVYLWYGGVRAGINKRKYRMSL